MTNFVYRDFDEWYREIRHLNKPEQGMKDAWEAARETMPEELEHRAVSGVVESPLDQKRKAAYET